MRIIKLNQENKNRPKKALSQLSKTAVGERTLEGVAGESQPRESSTNLEASKERTNEAPPLSPSPLLPPLSGVPSDV